jgi:hypothetical protein
MPVIKARTRGKHVVRHITRLDRESYETLFAYASFLGEPPEYVLNQLIDTVLAKDKEFLASRTQAPTRRGRLADAHAHAFRPLPPTSWLTAPEPRTRQRHLPCADRMRVRCT